MRTFALFAAFCLSAGSATAAKLAETLAPKDDFATEVVEGGASNQDEALKILARVHEALNTVSLFGGDKLTVLSAS